MGLRSALGDDSGSAVAEFVMVVSLLTVLTLSVLQLGLALHIRNTVLDAAAEGARFAALADSGLPEGEARTRDLITAAVGAAYATNVRASYGAYAGHASAQVTVIAPLPLLGLIGPGNGLEVVGHAAVETLDQE
ncbi:TadE/TadG family type IV pilus assembly protein [Glaciibacter sp. 2TAF33]|uniref:TadE/TadG family type IV pilus assembly protein n=1 Tax=Glaciibacter sp. 2TAF33 TaxID=3233015 RepID=UPI003F918662